MSGPTCAASTVLAAGGALAVATAIGCGELPPVGPDATLDLTAPDDDETPDDAEADIAEDAESAEQAIGDERREDADAGAPRCPDDMAYVETDFCPDVERRCLEMEHERPNNLEICHEFAREQRCRLPERRLAFCIDRYEYPNERGGHPVWMLDWYEAQATCESRGKRLCGSSEWTAACEGPEHTPFPYGFARDHGACNMDNFYIEPARPGPSASFLFYSDDKDAALRELSRLDQSVPSGAMGRCRSGFGVYDLTGNLDEWVVSDEPPRERSRWAGLKGGAWGHVRSQCRAMTYSHDPEFRYYFVGFRCCRDAEGEGETDGGSARWEPSPGAVPPPPVDPRDFAPDPIRPVDPPGPTKTKFTWVRKAGD